MPFISRYAEYLSKDGTYIDLEEVLKAKEATALDIAVYGNNIYGDLRNVYTIPNPRGEVAATISVAYKFAKEEDGCN